MKPSIYVTRAIPEETIARLRTQFDVEVNPDDRALSRAELLDKVRGRAAIVALLTDAIDGEVLDASRTTMPDRGQLRRRHQQP